MSNRISANRGVLMNVLRCDGLFFLCLIVSVTHVLFNWYEVFMAIPMFMILLGKYISATYRIKLFWIIVFSVLYIIGVSSHAGVTSRSLYAIYMFPPIFYLAGNYVGDKYRHYDKGIVLILFSVVFMYAFRDFARLQYSIFNSEELIIKSRMVLDANGEATRGATGYAIIMSVLIAGLAFIFAPSQKGILRWIRITGIILGIFALYGMITTVTRTSLVEAFIVVSFSIYMMLFKKGNARLAQGIILGAIIIFGVVYYVITNSELAVLLDAYEERDEVVGFEASKMGGRSWIWINALKSLMFYPLGTPDGRIVPTGGYCHNMWLDVGLNAGWIPFIILLVISIINIRQCIHLLKDERYDYFTRLYIFSLFICFFLSCFVEPVLDNVYNHFLVYMLFCGVVNAMAQRERVVDDYRIL